MPRYSELHKWHDVMMVKGSCRCSRFPCLCGVWGSAQEGDRTPRWHRKGSWWICANVQLYQEGNSHRHLACGFFSEQMGGKLKLETEQPETSTEAKKKMFALRWIITRLSEMQTSPNVLDLSWPFVASHGIAMILTSINTLKDISIEMFSAWGPKEKSGVSPGAKHKKTHHAWP